MERSKKKKKIRFPKYKLKKERCSAEVLTYVSASFPGSAKRHFSPFWFSVEPSDTLAVRSSPALLNCSVYSELPAKVHWKKDGVLLHPDDRRQVLPDGSLLISSVLHSKHNKPDEGVYQCVATIENLGTISSRTARLNVAGTEMLGSS